MNLRETLLVIGFTEKETDKMIKDKRFGLSNHKRSIEDVAREIRVVSESYGVGPDEARRAIAKSPYFHRVKHAEKISELEMSGKFFGFGAERIKQEIIRTPQLAGISLERYAAACRVVEKVREEGGSITNDQALEEFHTYYGVTVYIPGEDFFLGRGKRTPPQVPSLLNQMRKVARSVSQEQSGPQNPTPINLPIKGPFQSALRNGSRRKVRAVV